MARAYLMLAAILAVMVMPATAKSGPVSADRPANGFAIAVNRAHVGYVVVTGRKSGDAAATEALRLCRKATGAGQAAGGQIDGNLADAGCETLVAARADHLIIGYGPDGSLMFSTNSSPAETAVAFEGNCRKSYGRPCAVDNTFNLAIFAQLVTPLAPRRFAAIALAASTVDSARTGRNDADPRIWVASGLPSAEQAIARAMIDCTAALGQGACRHLVTSGQTHVALYRDSGGKTGGFRINLSAQAALGDVDAECRAANLRCEIVGLQAATEDAVRAYDLENMRGVPLG